MIGDIAETELGYIISAALANKSVTRLVYRHVTALLMNAGCNRQSSQDFAREIVRLETYQNIPFPNLEAALRRRIADMAPALMLETASSSRVKNIFNAIKDEIIPGSILDFGEGCSGGILQSIVQKHRSVIISWNGHPIKDSGTSMYETVILLNTLHRSEKLEEVIYYAFHVASKRVIILESVTNNLPEYLYTAFLDWFYDRILVLDGDRKPNAFRFGAATSWEQTILRIAGKLPIVSKDCGICPHLNPGHHHLFVFDQ